MKEKEARAKQMRRFLKWVRRRGGWWYLICTPREEHMSPDMMRMLIRRLADESLYELIFVLLMVHRDEPYVQEISGYLLLDELIDRWEPDREQIVGRILSHLT